MPLPTKTTIQADDAEIRAYLIERAQESIKARAFSPGDEVKITDRAGLGEDMAVGDFGVVIGYPPFAGDNQLSVHVLVMHPSGVETPILVPEPKLALWKAKK